MKKILKRLATGFLAFATIVTALPTTAVHASEKQYDRKTRPGAAALLERDFKKTKEKGYNPKELSQLLKNEGIIIPVYLIKRFLADNRNVSFPQKAEHGEALEEGGTDLAQPFKST